MSVKVMAKIWEAGPASLGDRFVLLAIADHANDEGQAFPGVGSLARKTCMTERGVQKILRRLEADGWLLTDKRQGRYRCNLYTVMTPNVVHPTGAETNKKTPNKDALDPERGSLDPERGSPKPSLTIKEPSFRGSEIFEEPKAVRSLKTKSAIVSEIYALYPRKVARAAAEKAISKALATTPAEALREAVSAYAAAVALWPPEELQYVPFPASWFNGGRWEDDRATWQKKPKNGLTAPTREVHYAIR
jgi:hypothetical protein